MAYRFFPEFGRVSTWCVSRYGQAGWGSLEQAEYQSNAPCAGRWPPDLPPYCKPRTPSSRGHGAPQQTPAKQAR